MVESLQQPTACRGRDQWYAKIRRLSRLSLAHAARHSESLSCSLAASSQIISQVSAGPPQIRLHGACQRPRQRLRVASVRPATTVGGRPGCLASNNLVLRVHSKRQWFSLPHDSARQNASSPTMQSLPLFINLLYSAAEHDPP